MNVPKLFLGVCALILTLAGAGYLLVPELALALTGGFTLDASAVADVRATYGGLQLGVAAYLVMVLWRNLDVAAPLTLLAILFLSVGAARLGGFIAGDEVATLHLGSALFELAVSMVAGWLAVRTSPIR